jgi:hypothetical protein
MKTQTITLILLALLTVAGWTQQNRVQRVNFQSGESSATVKGGVARGESITYLLGAGAGQNMTVSVTSSEDNAVVAVYAPDGRSLGEGQMTEEMDMVWEGRLPASGDYRVVVSSSRGGSSFNAYFLIR